MQLNRVNTEEGRITRTLLFTTKDIIYGFNSSGSLLWKTTHTPTKSLSQWAVTTYHTPRLQQCIQRMQPTKGTHHWLHSSQRAETHTCHPRKRKKAASITNQMKWKERRDRRGRVKQGGLGGVKSSAQECCHPTNRGRVQQVLGCHWSAVNF